MKQNNRCPIRRSQILNGYRQLHLILATVFLLVLESYSVHAQNILVVQTIAALRAVDTTSPFTNDTIALVIDYYGSSTFTAGRGGGHFRWRTPYSSINRCCGNLPAEDGGRYIASSSNTNGLWERMLEGEVPNVKMWGAYGDGVNNDYLSISNAITACGAWSVSGAGVPATGELLFPAGVYRITNTLIFNSAAVHIRGEGPANTEVLMETNYACDIFQTYNAAQALLGSTPGWDHGLIFENLRLVFEGTEATRNTNHSALVICQPGEAHSIRNIVTINGGIGIRCLGSGAPGLKLRDVTLSDVTIAGLCIEPVPGSSCGGGDAISVIGISGDCQYSNAMPTASLILFSNSYVGGSISQIKAEGGWGGGVIQYIYASSGCISEAPAAALDIDNTYYNGGYATSSNFITLKGQYAPIVTISKAHLNGVKNLINDQVTGRNVEADIQILTGDSQQTALLPMTYIGTGSTHSSYYDNTALIIGQTAFSYLYVTNAGWYRVLMPLGIGPSPHIAGKLTLTLPGWESTELQVDVNTASGNAWLDVARCTYGSGQPTVTQARAFIYTDATLMGPWAYVDIYVGNPITGTLAYPKVARMTITMDYNGYSILDGFESQLIGQIQPVSATLPVGIVPTQVYLYR